VGPAIIVVLGAVVVEVVAVVLLAPAVSAASSVGVVQAASRSTAANMAISLKCMGCPLEKSPDSSEERVDLELVITKRPLRKAYDPHGRLPVGRLD
jgi:hypothetical protein